MAMASIDKQMAVDFPFAKPHSLYSTSDCQQYTVPSGGYLVLQLHDELMYEVNAKDLPHVARIVKTNMEVAMQLTVCLPVNVKVGSSWGELLEYSI